MRKILQKINYSKKRSGQIEIVKAEPEKFNLGNVQVAYVVFDL